LLENHGVVCWADTVTHAEWCVEVLDTYCRTLILASQLGRPIRRIPQDKISGLLAIKQRLGLPDARFDVREHDGALSHTIASNQPRGAFMSGRTKRNRDESFEKLIMHLTNEVIRFASLQKK
jgi:L-fuculose-phosphate aldolase